MEGKSEQSMAAPKTSFEPRAVDLDIDERWFNAFGFFGGLIRPTRYLIDD